MSINGSECIICFENSEDVQDMERNQKFFMQRLILNLDNVICLITSLF